MEYIDPPTNNSKNLKRIIVTGANGFIGTNLVKKLLSNKKLSIVLISNTNNSNEEFFRDKQAKENLPLSFYTADIRDRKTLSKIFARERADTCVHLAAKISVADSIKNPKETIDINVNGTINLLEACYASQVKNFIFASSAAVYGDISQLPIREDVTLAPLSPYGSSKMLAEQKILEYQKSGKIPKAIMLRIFNVYGQRQHDETDVISKFAARLSNGLPPVIYGDGLQTRDFIHVDDVADSISLSIKSIDDGFLCGELKTPPIFNIGTGMPTSINQIAEKMIKILGLELKPTHLVENDNKAILHSYADITRAKNALGFIAKKGMEEGLRQIVPSTLKGGSSSNR
jgi:UDP-glucose 4-epimerase